MGVNVWHLYKYVISSKISAFPGLDNIVIAHALYIFLYVGVEKQMWGKQGSNSSSVYIRTQENYVEELCTEVTTGGDHLVQVAAKAAGFTVTVRRTTDFPQLAMWEFSCSFLCCWVVSVCKLSD